MLGVRHYHGCAIDLWCGDPNQFVADVHETDVFKVLNNIGMHVAFVPQDEAEPYVIFEHFKSIIPQLEFLPRRITLIFRDLTRYKSFQAILFDAFPELDDA